MTDGNYSRDEEDRIVEVLRGGGRPDCPRCGARLTPRSVNPLEGVPYVRNRVWLTCEGCPRSVVLDRRRIEESP